MATLSGIKGWRNVNLDRSAISNKPTFLLAAPFYKTHGIAGGNIVAISLFLYHSSSPFLSVKHLEKSKVYSAMEIFGNIYCLIIIEPRFGFGLTKSNKCSRAHLLRKFNQHWAPARKQCDDAFDLRSKRLDWIRYYDYVSSKRRWGQVSNCGIVMTIIC